MPYAGRMSPSELPPAVQEHLLETAAWLEQLPPLSMDAAALPRTAIVVVDILEGFTRQGALASPRVEGIIAPSVELLRRALAAGLQPSQVALMADDHPKDAEEFRAFPPHCVQHTTEADWVPEVLALPQAAEFRRFTKNSVASHHTPELEDWLDAQAPELIIALGDVTDLCLYSLGLHLQTRTQTRGLGQRIIIPASCVQTWDAPDHPAELYHPLFLRQLSRIGAEVVADIYWPAVQ